jgi:hypothetical protein
MSTDNPELLQEQIDAVSAEIPSSRTPQQVVAYDLWPPSMQQSRMAAFYCGQCVDND